MCILGYIVQSLKLIYCNIISQQFQVISRKYNLDLKDVYFYKHSTIYISKLNSVPKVILLRKNLITTYLGMGTVMTAPWTWGLRFIPEFWRALTAASRAWGKLDMLIESVVGVFDEIWARLFNGNLPSLVVTWMWSKAPVIRNAIKNFFLCYASSK